MPTCRVSRFRPSLASPSGTRSAHCFQSTSASIIGRRHGSSAAALKPKSNDQSHRPSVRTVLHKAELLLPRVLSLHEDSSKPTSLKFWKGVLNQAYDSLNASPTNRAARVVVYGYDECSGSQELVTALLEEPFSPKAQKHAVQNRWKGLEQESHLIIGYAHPLSEKTNAVQIQATWLQQFAIPVELHEMRTAASRPPANNLFSADVPIIVYNPVTTPLSQLLEDPSLPLAHVNAILAVVTSPNAPPGTWKNLSRVLPKTLTTIFVDPSRAIGAIRALSLDAGSSLAVQRYQDDYTGSRVADLTRILADKLSAASGGDSTGLAEVTTREQVQASLVACGRVLKNADVEIGEVVAAVLSLRDKIAELEARAGPEILGADGGKVVADAVARAKAEVKIVLDNMTWWRSVWRVDDVEEIVRTAVDKAWCRELEDTLIFHTGRLASSQNGLDKAALKVATRYTSPSAFHSPVLENALSQLRTSSAHPIQPNSLTAPIHQRKAQLAYPTQMMHSTAQQVALGTGGSVLGGFGLAWAGWAEHLGAFGGLFGTGLELETAVGAGMLVTVVGIRWTVARWEKAKRRWWRDWDRVGQGLERDLRVALVGTIDRQISVISRTTCESLEQIVGKRREEVEALKEELNELRHELNQT
ncbi:hypothetical protein BDW22DRAFT_1486518 [Trametopsis cervina]|nr:hypothetical protein BDW22DRAFT_1486518 [Trametopsis cervina]